MEKKMNIITLALGIIFFGFGVFSIILRIKSPEKFGKLEAMKNKFGDRGGIVIHIIFYSVLPILAGIVFIVCGILGIRIF
jgi:hypothetical protein